MGRVEIQHQEGNADVSVDVGLVLGDAAGRDCAGPAARHPLTGLPGESELRARIRQAIDCAAAESHAAAVVAVECGAAGSDECCAELLTETTRRLRPHVGPGDFLAHIGDARFALLLARIEDCASAERVAGAVVHDLTRPVRIGARDAAVHAHVGVAVAPVHGDQPASLLDSAEAARREAASLGGATYLLAR